MDKKEIKIIRETTEKLLKLLEVDGKFDILENKDEDSFDIVLDTKDTGIVIGYHGDTLEGLQLILSLCVAKKLNKFVRVSVEVGDYKKNRTDFLKNLALETKERALSQNQEIVVPELKSWERRVVHLILQNDEEVVSESQGVGRDRVLIVKPKV